MARASRAALRGTSEIAALSRVSVQMLRSRMVPQGFSMVGIDECLFHFPHFTQTKNVLRIFPS